MAGAPAYGAAMEGSGYAPAIAGSRPVTTPAVRARGLSGLSERQLGLLFVVPAVGLMLLVAAYPILSAMWQSLHRENVKFPQYTHFIGLANYTRILGSSRWWDSVITTSAFTCVSVTIEFVLGLLMALVMNKAFGAWTGLIRVAVLVPWATITVVTALAWKWLFTPTSSWNVLNGVLAHLPFVQQGCVMCGRWSAVLGMVAADTWKTAPFIALLLLAGLQSVDSEMYEAADVDGASKWQQFVKITLPALKPAILVALLFRTLDAFRMFDLVYLMTGGANKTETVSLVAYDHLIRRLDVGLGSALSVLIFLMVLGIALLFTKVLGAQPNQD